MQTPLKKIISQLDTIIIGKQHQLKLAMCCLLAKGHLLIEDVPGIGKTTLSQSLAKCLGLGFNRVQFTSDMLPSDILGVSIYDQDAKTFSFKPGPIFTECVLADELNRASPKTQSALLEAMEEQRVSIDGQSHKLKDPFFVIATQNPIEQAGTYPLPESQLDRFLMRIQLGYPDMDAERAMLQTQASKAPVQQVAETMTVEQLLHTQQQVEKIHTSDAIIDYILRLVNFSRQSEQFPHGLSPRATKAILIASKGWAFLLGRDHVLPEDVQAILPSVCEHRLRGSMSTAVVASLSQRLLKAIDPLAA